MKTKHKIKLLIAVIGALAIVIGAFIQGNDKPNVNTTINGNDAKVYQGDNIEIHETDNSQTTVQNNINLDYDFKNKSAEELLRLAERACKQEEYDYAYDIYSLELLNNNEIALTNLGYLYANCRIYGNEPNFELAIECYEKANCIQAKRNLLALHLKLQTDEAQNILDYMLYVVDDDLTWDFISFCLSDSSWKDYQSKYFLTKEEFSFEYDNLYNWYYCNDTYRGYNPPADTYTTRWIFVGIDFDQNDPYVIYKKQKILFGNYLDLLEKLYYM